ncbi:MAG: M50 family metallopeptidase [Clostridia bacterium]|nr:M50 family metallopeptidase [Clostridia bacterium]
MFFLDYSMITFVGVLESIGYILLGLLALMFMIVIHELGHYISGKLLGFKVVEFGIGFGPPIFKKTNKKSGEIFSIRPIPLGGFCRFEEEEGESLSPTAFNNQPAWKRIIVLFSGALFNFISALIIITIFFSAYGQVVLSVDNMYPDSANSNGVLQKGDIFLKINNRNLNILEAGDAYEKFSESDGALEVTILRNGEKIKTTIIKGEYTVGTFDEYDNFIPSETGEKFTGYGFSGTLSTQKLPFFDSIARAFSYMFFIVFKIFQIFGRLFTGKIGLNSLGGPVSTIQLMTEAGKAGFASLTFVVSVISANLAVMNLLPIPALDGSRIVFCLIEIIRKKPVSKKIEGIIHTVGFFMLILFAIFIDLYRFIK